MTPRSALHPEELAKLVTDNIDVGDWWIQVDETSVTIAHQKLEQDAIALLSIPRGTFCSLVDWFHKAQP